MKLVSIAEAMPTFESMIQSALRLATAAGGDGSCGCPRLLIPVPGVTVLAIHKMVYLQVPHGQVPCDDFPSRPVTGGGGSYYEKIISKHSVRLFVSTRYSWS